MDSTSKLSLPYILASQADKHVSINEIVSDLDVWVQAIAISANLSTPPSSPTDGDTYIIPLGATGAWAGAAQKIAVFDTNQWRFLSVKFGVHVWVLESDCFWVSQATGWVSKPGGLQSINPVSLAGINTNATSQARLSVKTNEVILSHDETSGGSGDMRLKVNKSVTAKTASLLFQNDWQGRVEAGLLGDDTFSLKLSPNGSTWKTAMIADPTSAAVKFPNGIVDKYTGLAPMNLLPAVIKDIWRSDMDAPATPRSYVIASITGATVTIATNEVEQFFNVGMRDAAMVRIWNISKSPAQAAWVNFNVAANAFNVSNVAHISGWVGGETLRIGDPIPTATNALQMVAIDISNYLFNNYGVVFPQRGLKLSVSVQGVGGRAETVASGSGAIGSAFGLASNSDGTRQSGFIDIFTTQLSPVSNSNLLFVRESLVGATALAATRLIRLAGIWV
jgi:hypothetical protein